VICDAQISTSAQQATEDVTMKLPAVTHLAALRAPVTMDTLEMGQPVRVSKLEQRLRVCLGCRSLGKRAISK